MPEPFGLIGTPTVAGMANLLRLLADQTGEEAFRRAERAMRQQPAGRHSVDDRLMIEEVLALVSAGEVKTLNQALQRVARTRAGRQSVRAVAERLRRKIVAAREKSSPK